MKINPTLKKISTSIFLGTALGFSTCASAMSKLDVVFIIDESGSMRDAQQSVKDRLNDTIIPGLAGTDFSLGLVGFGAGTGSGTPHILSTVMSGSTDFSNALNNLVVDISVGATGNEPGFSATVLGMSSAMNLRSDAETCAVIITDEDADAGATKAEALAALNAQNAVFFGVVKPNFGTTGNDYGPNIGSLAQATGGQIFNIDNFTQNAAPVLTALIQGCIQATVAKGCGCPATPAKCTQANQGDTKFICGSDNADSFLGTNDAETFCSYAGNDSILARGGNDCIDAGNGDNSVHAGKGDDKIFTGSGNNQIYGNSGNDEISSGAGNDDIAGHEGDDTISAGAGDDNVEGGHGDDKIDAGEGHDIVNGNAGQDECSNAEIQHACESAAVSTTP